jgi:hypothetical protein
MKWFMIMLLLLGLCALVTLAQESGTSPPANTTPTSVSKPTPSAITNEDVIKLAKLGFGDDVIIAKIQGAAFVSFKLETDDLVALKESGVSQPIIAAMIKKASSPSSGTIIDTPMGAVAAPGADDILVRLVTKDKTIDLTSIAGHIGTTWAFFTVLSYMDYPNIKAEVRIGDLKPFILIQTRKSPQGRFYLVYCKPNKDNNNRSVKMGKSGMYTASDFGAPDGDWTVPFEVKQLQPGLWRMDPKNNLKPGEYGVWGPSSELYDFGVDN